MSRKHVLIYDDDLELLKICSMILSDQGFEVITRNNCDSILTDVRDFSPVLVFMDNWIPNIGGVNAIRMLRNEGYTSLPVVFFTAINNAHEIGVNAGADYILTKPFNIDELEEMARIGTDAHKAVG